jgi:uncharacterized protein (DUF2336 family)
LAEVTGEERTLGQADRMSSPQSVLAELEEALGSSPSARTFSIMRQITDMFVDGAEQFSVSQVAVFDDILCRLLDHNGPAAAVEVSTKLAPLPKGPSKVVRRLTGDNDLAVSGPFLRSSCIVPDEDLVQFVKTKRKEYLALLATRPQLSEAVTDVLIDRGDVDVMRVVTANPGAKISEGGFARLISEARQSKEITAMLLNRPDLPDELRPFAEMNLKKLSGR